MKVVPFPAELQLKKLFEERETLQGQVSLLKSQLNQRERDGTDRVQNPEGDGLGNGMNSHVLDLQSEYSSSPVSVCLICLQPNLKGGASET